MINRRQIHHVRRLRNEFVDRVLHAQGLVELARDARQRTVRSFISGPARQVECNESKAGRIPGYSIGLGGVILDFLDFELARGPCGGVSQSTEANVNGGRTRSATGRA